VQIAHKQPGKISITHVLAVPIVPAQMANGPWDYIKSQG